MVTSSGVVDDAVVEPTPSWPSAFVPQHDKEQSLSSHCVRQANRSLTAMVIPMVSVDPTTVGFTNPSVLSGNMSTPPSLLPQTYKL
ncbi:hypothetical protein H632_c5658p0, partial [Helicosporidium sp. ATCC 50920]